MLRRLVEYLKPPTYTSWRGDPLRDKSQKRPIENESQRQKIVQWCRESRAYYESVLPGTDKGDVQFIMQDIHLLTSIMLSAYDKHPTFFANQLVTAATLRIRTAIGKYASPGTAENNNQELFKTIVSSALEIMTIGDAESALQWKKRSEEVLQW